MRDAIQGMLSMSQGSSGSNVGSSPFETRNKHKNSLHPNHPAHAKQKKLMDEGGRDGEICYNDDQYGKNGKNFRRLSKFE